MSTAMDGDQEMRLVNFCELASILMKQHLVAKKTCCKAFIPLSPYHIYPYTTCCKAPVHAWHRTRWCFQGTACWVFTTVVFIVLAILGIIMILSSPYLTPI